MKYLYILLLVVLPGCVSSGSFDCSYTHEKVWKCKAKGEGNAQ